MYEQGFKEIIEALSRTSGPEGCSLVWFPDEAIEAAQRGTEGNHGLNSEEFLRLNPHLVDDVWYANDLEVGDWVKTDPGQGVSPGPSSLIMSIVGNRWSGWSVDEKTGAVPESGYCSHTRRCTYRELPDNYVVFGKDVLGFSNTPRELG